MDDQLPPPPNAPTEQSALSDLLSKWQELEAAEDAEIATRDGFVNELREQSRETVVALPDVDYLAALEATQASLLRGGLDGELSATGDSDRLLEQRRIVSGHARAALSHQVSNFSIAPDAREEIVADLVNDILGLGPIDHLVRDPSVSEIIVRGARRVTIERAGKLEDVAVTFRSDDHVRAVAQRIAGRVGRKVDESDPMVDARLPDGSRVNVIMPPVSLIGPIITIRKFQPRGYSLADLTAKGSMTEEIAGFLAACIEARVNAVVSGSTGSGKTTLLKALAYQIPHHEYIVTIEDSAELQLADVHPRVSPLETRPANSSGVGEVSIRKLLRNSLRMRPDRIVVGECRSSEALDMLQAMNTGHEGSLTTCHANSVRDAVLSRIPTMAAMSSEVDLTSALLQTITAIELGVQVTRDARGGRYIVAVVEVDPGPDPLTPVLNLLYERRGDGWVKVNDPAGRVAVKLAARRDHSAAPSRPAQDHSHHEHADIGDGLSAPSQPPFGAQP